MGKDLKSNKYLIFLSEVSGPPKDRDITYQNAGKDIGKDLKANA